MCGLLLLSSCNTLNIKNPIYEVDLKDKKEVQLTYNRNIYNTLICYNSGFLVVEFLNNGDAYDGMVFSVGENFCKADFNGVEYELPEGVLTESLFVCDLYSFVSSSDGVLTTEAFDESTGCSYISRRQGTRTFTFEIFENNGVFAYSLKIT